MTHQLTHSLALMGGSLRTAFNCRVLRARSSWSSVLAVGLMLGAPLASQGVVTFTITYADNSPTPLTISSGGLDLTFTNVVDLNGAPGTLANALGGFYVSSTTAPGTMDWTFSRDVRLVSYDVVNAETDGDGTYFNLSQGVILSSNNPVGTTGVQSFTNVTDTFAANTAIFFATGDAIEGRTSEFEGFVLNSFTFSIVNATAFWTGDQGSSWATNNAGNTNFSVAQDGAVDTSNTPAFDTAVTFSASNVVGGTQTTTLDADFTIKSLTIADPAAVTINPGGAFSLTINDSIDLVSGAGFFTLNANLILGGDLVITAQSAAGGLISGNISGAFGIQKVASGTLILTGTNTYTGKTKVDAGTLVIGANGSLSGGTDTTVSVEGIGNLSAAPTGAINAGTGANGVDDLTNPTNGISGHVAVNFQSLGTFGNEGNVNGGTGGAGGNATGAGLGGSGGNGGIGLTVNSGEALLNAATGVISGGTGGLGGSSTVGIGGNGGDGGFGVQILGPGGTFTNLGNINGGTGGVGGSQTGANLGGTGGTGGTGLSVESGATINVSNEFIITGGTGGKGGSAPTGIGGYGGTGGTGIYLAGSSNFENTCTANIYGGLGGEGGNGPIDGAGGMGGTGLFFNTTNAFTNDGGIYGGNGGNGLGSAPGGLGGTGFYYENIGKFTNMGIIKGGDGGLGGESFGGGGPAGHGGTGFSYDVAGQVSSFGSILGGNGAEGSFGSIPVEGGMGGNALMLNAVGGAFDNYGPITGGSGGNGGGTFSGTSALGGNGGAGAFFTSSTLLTNSGHITGGTGGQGGTQSGESSGNISGDGGTGGPGVLFHSGTGGILFNTGTITGGTGGAAGTNNYYPEGVGTPGAGGAGVEGADANIITSGTISGGMSGDGLTQAPAINFTGGTNMLELRHGFALNGVVVGGGTDTIVLGGNYGYFEADDAKYQNIEYLVMTNTGYWSFDGTGTFINTEIQGGRFAVYGTLRSNLQVLSGAKLAGTGSVTGTVTVANGGILEPGLSPGTLTFGGLVLNPQSILNYQLGVANTAGGGSNDFIVVNGDLVLDGLLNVSYTGPLFSIHFSNGGFNPGTYRLMDYSGTLTNNGLTINSIPDGVNPGNLLLDVGTVGQVNLIYALTNGTVINANGAVVATNFVAGQQYWDGSNYDANGIINGGDGVWRLSDTNWTNVQGMINGRWFGQTAVFTAVPGTVTLADNIPFEKLIFEIGGYRIVGGNYQLYSLGDAEIQTITGTTTLNATTVVNGRFTKSGAGKLDLRSPLFAAGGTVISQGILAVNSVLTSPSVLVSHGATLQGVGLIIGNVTNSGTVAPGNSIGTLTIDGNYTQRSNGTLQIEIGSPSNHDVLVVSGTAKLSGTLEIASLGYGPEYGDQIPFLVAGKITGKFNQIEMPQSDLYRGRFLDADGIGVLLVAPTSYTLVANTPNEHSVARALDEWIGIETGDIGDVTLALDLLREEQYRDAFNAIMPGYYESAMTTATELSHSHSQVLHQYLSARRLGTRFAQGAAQPPLSAEASGKNPEEVRKAVVAVQPVSEDYRWNAWTMGSGLFSEGGISLQPGEDFESGTYLAGADYAFNEHFALGLFASYQEGWGDYDYSGDIDLESTRFGAYATFDFGGFYANAVVGGGQTGFDVKRPIQWAYLDRDATSEPDGYEFFTSLGAGYDIKAGNWTLGPQLTVQYSDLQMGEFTETGAGSLNLRVKESDMESLRSYLGGRVAYTIKVNETFAIIPEFRAFWQHEYLDGGDISAQLDSGFGGSFGYQTEEPDRDAVYIGAGLGFQIGPRFYANLYYNAEFGRNDDANHTISVSATVKF